MKKYRVCKIYRMEYATKKKAVDKEGEEIELKEAIQNADIIDYDPEIVDVFEAESPADAVKIAHDKGYKSTAWYEGYTIGTLIKGDFYYVEDDEYDEYGDSISSDYDIL